VRVACRTAELASCQRGYCSFESGETSVLADHPRPQAAVFLVEFAVLGIEPTSLSLQVVIFRVERLDRGEGHAVLVDARDVTIVFSA
jgi:hypothetical protein